MIYLLLNGAILVYGLVQAVKPELVLRRKYWGEEIPAPALRTARVVGILVAIFGGVCFFYDAHFLITH